MSNLNGQEDLGFGGHGRGEGERVHILLLRAETRLTALASPLQWELVIKVHVDTL